MTEKETIMKSLKVFVLTLIAGLAAAPVQATLKVVTTTEDMASLTREVGGKLVDVNAIAKGYQDPHFVDAKPSYLLKLRSADLLVVVGLELEVGWLPPLLTNARNSKIIPGYPGYLDASRGCDVMQKPAGTVDRSLGDVHPLGNPHYWTDPDNGRIIAQRIAAKLQELDPSNAKTYAENLAAFQKTLTDKEKQWDALAADFKDVQVVTYHNSWPNFAKHYHLNIVNHVEPKPGIPPSPAHIQELISQIKRDKIPLILVEPYFDERLPEKIARETGAKLIIFPPSVGGDPAIKSYFDLFDHNLKLLHDAVGGKK